MATAHVFKRDHINTDEIIPARYLNTSDEAELAHHALEDLDPTFAGRVQPGDILIGGENFGCGSSREHAVWALRGAGVKAVIAPSFARIFYRNAINNGFLIIECNLTETAATGDCFEINPTAGTLRNLTRNQEHTFVPLSDFAQNLLAAGGLLPFVVARMKSAEPRSESRLQAAV
ncbi:MAG: 3-isopropylmalate dehydratase small subunit [Blastocatellia bacterium]|nr:3-isopropylmalate dehydratase small subunit [Blastocatellia bacterium]